MIFEAVLLANANGPFIYEVALPPESVPPEVEVTSGLPTDNKLVAVVFTIPLVMVNPVEILKGTFNVTPAELVLLTVKD